MNTIICIAVRMDSKRLPGKAIMPLYGEPLIKRLTQRIKKAKLPDHIVWCTTIDKTDDILGKLAEENNINIIRGSRLNVMSRFLQAADEYNATTIVRVTGDNPLTCPDLIDKMLEHHKNIKVSEYTYTNDVPRGIRSEIINVKALRDLYSKVEGNKSEYMTYQLKNGIRFQNKYKSCIGYIHRTFTVDTPQEYLALHDIYNRFKGDPPSINKIIKYINR